MFQEFPKWLYHKTEQALIVQNQKEQDALGKGWKETPFTKVEEQTTTTEEPQTGETEVINFDDIESTDAEHHTEEKSEVKKTKGSKKKAKK